MFSAMNGPKRLWSGDWSEESAAARARMAQRRAQRSALGDDPTEPLADDPTAPRVTPTPPPPAAPSRARQLLAAVALRWRAAIARARAAKRPMLVPRGLRARLLVIALLAGLGGAAVTIGVEAASGSTTPRAFLGVDIADATGEPGALVESVYPGSPAAAAGIEPGDVITQINGSPISDGSAAVSAIDSLRPGEQITLGIERVGQQVTITATLGTRPNAP